MNKLKMLRIVNIFVILDFLVIATCILLYLYAPSSSPLNGNATLVEIHQTGGLIFLGLIILHIILNWNWIVAQYLKKKKPAPAVAKPMASSPVNQTVQTPPPAAPVASVETPKPTEQTTPPEKPETPPDTTK